MLSKTAVISLLLVTAAGAASTVSIQSGVTQFYGGDGWYYGSDQLGFKSDLAYEYEFGNWALNVNLRGIAFPGEANSFSWYVDLNAPYYLTDAPIRVFAQPGLGYSHCEKRSVLWDTRDRIKHDFVRFVCGFGLKVISGSKYFLVRYVLVPEIPTGERSLNTTRDFFLEQTVEGEFGWALARHFGFTFRAGAVRDNYAISLNTASDYSPYVPFVEVGPSIYF
jgi:hypothetical protein